MSAHTPGPWEALESTEDTPLPAGVPVSVGTANGKGARTSLVCDIRAQGINGRYDSNVTAANARLIAAAPELLEALIVLTAGVEVAGLHKDIPPAYEMALAAIAKATGEES